VGHPLWRPAGLEVYFECSKGSDQSASPAGFYYYFVNGVLLAYTLKVLPALLCGLKDREDDVRAVSAECLIPVLPELVTGSSDSVNKFISSLVLLMVYLTNVEGSSSAANLVGIAARFR
jgi:hypothetical protein